MKFYILSLFVLGWGLVGLGQTFSGQVVDENNEPFPFVIIRDTVNKVVTQSNIGGFFSIGQTENSVYQFSFIGYKTVYVSAKENPETVQLKPDSRLLNEVTVESEGIRPVFDVENCNTLDYRIYDKVALLLYAYKGERYIGVNYLDTTVSEVYSLNGIKARTFADDCYGNLHLLTKHKAYQIGIQGGVQFIAEAPIKQFEKILKPCVASINSVMMVEAVSDHNKKYTLAAKEKGDVDFRPFFSVWDEKEAFAANELYKEIIALYYASTDSMTNIIVNKVWDGTMRELAFTPDLVVLIGFYENTIASDVEVTTVQSGAEVFVFDEAFDSIHVFNEQTNKTHQTHWEVANQKGELTEILHDKKTNQFYFYTMKKGKHYVFEILPDSGQMELLYELSVPWRVKNVQIADGNVYFLRNENGFYKLFRESFR